MEWDLRLLSRLHLQLLALAHQQHGPRIQVRGVILKMARFIRDTGMYTVTQHLLLFIRSERHLSIIDRR